MNTAVLHSPTDELLEAYPPLTPMVAPWVNEVLDDQMRLQLQFQTFGSPLNVHAMHPFRENHAAYTRVLDTHGLRHMVFFARKANKCSAFVEEAKRNGFGVDTASFRELDECLRLWCDPQKLVLTAAIKNQKMVALAIQHGVTIILDNFDECRLVNTVARTIGKTANVGVRVNGFRVDGKPLYSRFGFPVDDVPELVTNHFGAGKSYDQLSYQGLHFHLNGYSRKQRGEALIASIRCADALKEAGITTSFIDMGGGLLINYLAHKSEWDTFHEALREAVLGLRKPITFDNNALGLQRINGRLHGEPTVYPYYNETPKADFLDTVLKYKNNAGVTVSTLLRDRNIELRLEPGRSLLDQAGVTIARVAFRKKDSRGNLLVGLEMNRSQLCSSSADFLLDPIYVPRHTNLPLDESTPCAVTFVGAYCLEQDIILKRKIVLPNVPQIGDWICFVNTAGYMMHFYETEAHLFDLGVNLIATFDAGGNITYARD